MKNIKKMIMGTAAVMSVLTIGALSVSAQGATPQMADYDVSVMAAESVNVDTNTASNVSYSVIAAGNAETSEDICVSVKDAESIDITDVVITVKQDKENKKFMISWDNGKTWFEMNMPIAADAQK